MSSGKTNSHERNDIKQEMPLKIRSLEGEGHCFHLTQKLLRKEKRSRDFQVGTQGETVKIRIRSLSADSEISGSETDLVHRSSW